MDGIRSWEQACALVVLLYAYFVAACYVVACVWRCL